jgi:hypothetical protein
MRTLITLAAVLAVLAIVPDTADANHQGRKRKTCDHTCVRAEAQDRAGDYKAYPDWARVALAPRYGSGSRR